MKSRDILDQISITSLYTGSGGLKNSSTATYRGGFADIAFNMVISRTFTSAELDTGAVPIGTVAAGYRPIKRVFSSVLIYDHNMTSTTTGDMYIDPSGEIGIYRGLGVADIGMNSRFFAQFHYPTY